jgi:O-succinylhomoserine sulfhydrylase
MNADAKRDDEADEWKTATALIHGGTLRSQFQETSEAIFLTSGFVHESSEAAEGRFEGAKSGYVYSRYANPTVGMFEERMRMIEGAEASRATASGMSAVFTALFAQLKAGDHLVAGRALFGSCHYIVHDLLPRFGVETTLVDGRDLGAWEAAVRPNTKAFFYESPTNPTLEIVDIPAVSEIAHAAGALVTIDNVFATPLLQNPLKLGADVVVYSATKHIDGQGRCLGGIVLGPEKLITENVHDLLKHTGPSMSPFNAWICLKGLETLPVRLERQCASAETVTEFLTQRPEIDRVFFPSHASHPQYDLAMKQMSAGGQIVSFEVKGGKEAAFAFQNALKIIKISNNLGDVKSLITHPATTTHQRIGAEARAELGIGDGLVRISVGLEDITDLLADIDQALTASRL